MSLERPMPGGCIHCGVEIEAPAVQTADSMLAMKSADIRIDNGQCFIQI